MTFKSLISLLFIHFATAKIYLTCPQAVFYFDKYKCEQEEAVGEGASGKAFLVRLTTSKARPRILKVQQFVDNGKKERALFERNLISSFDHANIIRLFESRQTNDYLFEVIEYGQKGSLNHLLQTDNTFGKDRIRVLRMFREILQGVRYMHSLGWIHADLKADNIVVDEHENAKLIDFDLSVRANKQEYIRGTAEYMEPDLLLSKGLKLTFDQYMDVYALGVLLYEMVSMGRVPFTNVDRQAFPQQVKEGNYKFYAGIDVEIAYLVHNCIKFDRNTRFSIDQLIDHTDAALANKKPIELPNTKLINNRQEFFEVYRKSIERQHEEFLLANPDRPDIYLSNGMLVPLPKLQLAQPEPDNGIRIIPNRDVKPEVVVIKRGESRFLVVFLALLGLILLVFLVTLVICKSLGGRWYRSRGVGAGAGSSTYHTRKVITTTSSVPVESRNNQIIVREKVVNTSSQPIYVTTQSNVVRSQGDQSSSHNSSSKVTKTVTSGGKVVSSSYQSSSHTRTVRTN